jgi:hypothetical protein
MFETNLFVNVLVIFNDHSPKFILELDYKFFLQVLDSSEEISNG